MVFNLHNKVKILTFLKNKLCLFTRESWRSPAWLDTNKTWNRISFLFFVFKQNNMLFCLIMSYLLPYENHQSCTSCLPIMPHYQPKIYQPKIAACGRTAGSWGFPAGSAKATEMSFTTKAGHISPFIVNWGPM